WPYKESNEPCCEAWTCLWPTASNWKRNSTTGCKTPRTPAKVRWRLRRSDSHNGGGKKGNGEEAAVAFYQILARTQELLEREGRVAYRILKRRFELNDEDIEDLKADLIDAKRVAADEDGKVLVWIGATPVLSSEFRVLSSKDEDRSPAIGSVPLLSQDSALRTQHSAAERRQLTVMFCDLAGSTALSAQLDPEDYRVVVQRYQQTCSTVLQRHGGYLAQHLGDGLLVYFGYPTAHEDDARRAVRAGLGVVEALKA